MLYAKTKSMFNIPLRRMSMYFVYAHYLENRCIYVGCGNSNRPYNFIHRNENWKAIVGDKRPTVVILDQKQTFTEALECEKYHIERMKSFGFRLANKEPAKFWLGKKRSEIDPETMRKLHEASQAPEAIAKRAAAMRGRKMTQEQKDKLSAANRGRVMSDEAKRKISEAKTGRPNGLAGRVMPESHRKAISEATKGRRKLTDEEQARRFETWRERCGGKITTKKAKAVRCKETGVEYRCAKDAAEAVAGSDKHIQACCAGRRPKHKNLSWEYV
jgi:hypothetical protein